MNFLKLLKLFLGWFENISSSFCIFITKIDLRKYIIHCKVVIFEYPPLIGPVGRVFASGPGDLGSKTFKMVLDTSLTLSNIWYVSRVKWSNPG